MAGGASPSPLDCLPCCRHTTLSLSSSSGPYLSLWPTSIHTCCCFPALAALQGFLEPGRLHWAQPEPQVPP